MLTINALKRQVLLFVVMFFFLITVSAFLSHTSGKGIGASSGTSIEAAVSPGRFAPVQTLAPFFRQMVRVFIHGDDLYPCAVTVKPGRVVLRVENQTQTDASLMLEQILPGQAPLLIANVRTLLGAKRVDQELVLAAGTYVYFEENHPTIRGKLIVQ